MSRNVLFWMALLLIFSGVAVVRYASQAMRGAQQRVAATAPADHGAGANQRLSLEPTMDRFTLTDQLGRQFSSDSLQGKVWVGSFFFASCPGACILQNQRVQILQQKFGERGLKIVSITCDPERDTPARLKHYAEEKFQADPETWYFLTGDFDYIKQVGNRFFGVPVEKETHGSHLLLFDQQGKLQEPFSATKTESFDRLLRTLDKMLPQPAAPATPTTTATPATSAAPATTATPAAPVTPRAPVGSPAEGGGGAQ